MGVCEASAAAAAAEGKGGWPALAVVPVFPGASVRLARGDVGPVEFQDDALPPPFSQTVYNEHGRCGLE